MKYVFILLVFVSCVFTLHAQAEVQVIKKDQKKEAQIIEKADLQCLYEYSQTAKIGGDYIISTDSMMLEIGKNHSRYYNWNLSKIDSIFNSKMPSTDRIKSVSVIKDGSAESQSFSGELISQGEKRETANLYKDRIKKAVITIDREGLSVLKCNENIVVDWKIHEDTLTVMDYLCQRATTSFRGRDYEVWFAPEIPINDGPWKLYGLPGLILKVRDSEDLFSFLAIGLEKIKDDKEISIQKEDFIKANPKQMNIIREKRISKDMQMSIDGGNIIMFPKSNNKVYIPIEIN